MSYYLLFDNKNKHSNDVVAIIKLNDIVDDFYSHRVFSGKVAFADVSDIDKQGYILSKPLKKLVNNIDIDEEDDDEWLI